MKDAEPSSCWGRRRWVVVLAFTHLALLGGGAYAFVLMLGYRGALVESVDRQQLLESVNGQLQEQVYRPRQGELNLTTDPGRADHYIRKIARDMPGATNEVHKDPNLGNVAEHLDRRLRYPGPVLSDDVVEQMVRELSDFRTLAPHANTIRDYHRFVKQAPRAVPASRPTEP
jgi:hypothetical protein